MIICGPALLARSTFVCVRSTAEDTMCRPSTAHQSPAFGWQCPMNEMHPASNPTWSSLPLLIATGTVEASPSEPTASGGFRLGTKQPPRLPTACPSAHQALAPHHSATAHGNVLRACVRDHTRAAPASASRWPWPSSWPPSVPVPDLLQVALRHCRITPRNTMAHLAQPAGATSQLRHWPFCTNPLGTFSTCLGPD